MRFKYFYVILFLLFCILIYYLFNNQISYFSNVNIKRFKAPRALTKLKQIEDHKPLPTDINALKALLEPIDKSSYTLNGNIISTPSFFHINEKFPGALPRVYYQGSCGSCFSFAICTCLSSRFYIESCGISSCLAYPQINFGSLNNVQNNINEIYKFKQLYNSNNK